MQNILLILGTARQENMSQKAFNFVHEVLNNNPNLQVTPLYVSDFLSSRTQELQGSKLEAYKNLISNADGIIIVSPEYNHSFPGELKLLLDNAYSEYNGKPVAICGVSDGAYGGARMAEQLKLVLSAFQMNIINASVNFTFVKEVFLEDGSMHKIDFYTQKVNGMVESMIKYSK